MIGFVVQVADEVVAYLAALDVVKAEMVAHLIENRRNCICIIGRHENDELTVEPWNQTMRLCWILSKNKVFEYSI